MLKKIQAQWRYWICSSLFQFIYKNSDKSQIYPFQGILYMIDVWINNGSGWNIELIEFQYINISTSRPLSGSSYMVLPVKLKSPRKAIINIKNKDKKCFLWWHVRHINPSNEHPERIKKLLKIWLWWNWASRTRKRF